MVSLRGLAWIRVGGVKTRRRAANLGLVIAGLGVSGVVDGISGKLPVELVFVPLVGIMDVIHFGVVFFGRRVSMIHRISVREMGECFMEQKGFWRLCRHVCDVTGKEYPFTVMSPSKV